MRTENLFLFNTAQKHSNTLLERAINILAVSYYGEAEFWLCGGKVVLIAIVFCFTFVTMVGGNPQHDAYGFRHWKTPVSLLRSSKAPITEFSLGTFPRVYGYREDRSL